MSEKGGGGGASLDLYDKNLPNSFQCFQCIKSENSHHWHFSCPGDPWSELVGLFDHHPAHPDHTNLALLLPYVVLQEDEGTERVRVQNPSKGSSSGLRSPRHVAASDVFLGPDFTKLSFRDAEKARKIENEDPFSFAWKTLKTTVQGPQASTKDNIDIKGE